MMISVEEVKITLGEAYAYLSDNVIETFISRRTEELRDIIEADPENENTPYKGLLRKWLLNKVCIDIIACDLLGKSDEVIDYSLAELRESKAENVRLKLQWIETLKEAAELALSTYLLKTRGYRAVKV